MSIFTRHPNSVNETYLEHLLAALKMGALFLLSSVFQFVHAVFPFVHPPFGTDVKSLSVITTKRAVKAEKEAMRRGQQ